MAGRTPARSRSSGGSHTVDYHSTDKPGNIEPTKTVSFQIDATAPVTTLVAPPSPNGLNGWYVSAPTVTLTATDGDTRRRLDDVLDRRRRPDLRGAVPGVGTTAATRSRSGRRTTTATSRRRRRIAVKVDLNDPPSTAAITPAPERLVRVADGDADRPGRPGLGDRPHLSTRSTASRGTTYTGPSERVHDRQPLRPVPGDGQRRPGRGAVKLIAFKADAVKPTVNITTPADGEVYPAGQGRDGEVQVHRQRVRHRTTCVGTTANGANLDTSTIGDAHVHGDRDGQGRERDRGDEPVQGRVHVERVLLADHERVGLRS